MWRSHVLGRRNLAVIMIVGAQTVLIADAELEAVKLVTHHLAGGFRILTAPNGVAALDSARRAHPALVILDVLLPEMPGKEVLRALKADPSTAEIPVLILSSLTDEVDRIVCFELGADDYVAKPFSGREVGLRVRAILARRGRQPTDRYATIGNIRLDREGHEVHAYGKRICLTAREFRLLNALFSEPGRVFTRDDLLDAVWGRETAVEFRTVDTHMRRLRERLGSAATQIRTVRGFGYRLDAI
jgi:two-component system phosphate regulon response regulator PhoB